MFRLALVLCFLFLLTVDAKASFRERRAARKQAGCVSCVQSQAIYHSTQTHAAFGVPTNTGCANGQCQYRK